MKQFTTIKIGYTAGIYGCSGEYFTTVIINGKKNTSISHYGMYGSEERVNDALKFKGYKEFYTPSNYGQLKGKDINKNLYLSEQLAISIIKTELSSRLRG